MNLSLIQPGVYFILCALLFCSYYFVEKQKGKTTDILTQLTLLSWCICSIFIILFIHATSEQMDNGLAPSTNVILMYFVAIYSLSCSSALMN